jgi:alpha-D-ribose 1-methylphosphonate 5-triphosphate synthase subunit PhnG
MDKKRLSRILAKSESTVVAELSGKLKKCHSIVIVKEPNKTLTMIKMREPVKESLFYIGEVMVCEAIVELDGTKGIAVAMGDDFEKILNMAIIDAACNKGVFSDEGLLMELEKVQLEREQKENGMHLKTMVSFHSMDQEAPSDVSSFKKA